LPLRQEQLAVAALANEMERTHTTNDNCDGRRETWWHKVADSTPLGRTTSVPPENGDGTGTPSGGLDVARLDMERGEPSHRLAIRAGSPLAGRDLHSLDDKQGFT